ncbi:AsmA family protein [Luteimonas cucumeris]|uniref:AsmA family protein n=1 Tax=Luteimonas cucumeris TaxID=985012 RepID=UPI001F5490A0|nr:AsmA family protein [Luteimonas cucumeris]
MDDIGRHPLLVALGLLVLALVMLLLLWDWNWLKGPIERRVEAQTGRSLQIGGDLDVDLGRVVTVSADGLQFGNASWSKQPVMASADRLVMRIELWPTLIQRREIVIPELRLSRPQVRLETGPKGVGNWEFLDDSDDSEPPQFRQLWVDEGRLRFIDDPQRTDIDIALQSRAPTKPGVAPAIAVDGGGRWKGNRFRLEGHAESPLELARTEEPYRIDLRAAAGPTRARARGTLLDPLRLRDFDLRMTLSGQNLDDLFPLIGIALPPTPPYRFDGRLTRDSNTWRYDDFTGKVGNSDLGGSAHVTTGGARPMFKANLVSQRLDLDDLAGFIGAAPQSGRGEATNPELQALAAKQEASSRLLPDTPYELRKLRAMDADVRLKARRINASSLPIDNMDAHLYLDNGLLRLEPLNFGVADGVIRSNIRMNAREEVIRTHADIGVRGLNLAKLMPEAQLAQETIGRVGGKIAVDMRGNSIARMLGTADGDVAVGMGRGQISKLLMKLAGLNLAGAIRTKLTGDKPIPIRCAFGDFVAKDGLLTTRALVFDTTDTIVLGSGTVNLRDETLDLTMNPRPKGRSLLSLRSPLYVGGTFKNPDFKPDYARIGLRGAAALALGAIAPPAALLATTELGGGMDADCGSRSAK